MKTSPRVSVIIPAYKAEKYLAETIESVLKQTLKPFEIVVVIDGSPDRSAEIAASYPVTVICQENAGVAHARNTGWRASSGDWLAFLDADDVWEPEFLELCTSRDADVCYSSRRNLVQQSDGSFVFETKVHSHLEATKLHSTLPAYCPFPPSCVTLQRQAVEAVGGFDQRFSPSEDWEMWLRLSKNGARFAFMARPLVRYRVHRASASFNADKMYDAGLRVAAEHALSPRRTISRLQGEKALMLRENGRPGAMRLMVRSICKHPFHDLHRYKVTLHMLLTRAGLLPSPTTAAFQPRTRAASVQPGQPVGGAQLT